MSRSVSESAESLSDWKGDLHRWYAPSHYNKYLYEKKSLVVHYYINKNPIKSLDPEWARNKGGAFYTYSKGTFIFLIPFIQCSYKTCSDTFKKLARISQL